MKNIITLAVSLLSLTLYAQVGINNNAPKATLDITAKTTDGSKPEGLIAPRLTGDQIQAGDAQYGTAQKGSIVYATAAATSPSTKTANITAEGYYFFDGSVWQKITGASAGDTTNDAWINDTTNAMVKLGTNADGTPRTAGTDFVARDNGSVGIGTSSPDASAALDVTAVNKGLLPPRVALTGSNDITTIPNPSNGLVVFNTANAGTGSDQVYQGSLYVFFNGRWGMISDSNTGVSSNTGSLVYKTKFRGRNYQTQGYPKPTMLVPEVNLEFRWAVTSDGQNRLQVRLIKLPASNVRIYTIGHWQGASHSHRILTFTFTPANYNVYQDIDSPWSEQWAYYYLIASDEVRVTGSNPVNYVTNLYGLCGFNNGWGDTNEPYSLAAEVF